MAEPTQAASARNLEEEMLIKLLLGNFMLTAQVAYGRSKPRVAKFATLLNRDINLKWEEYMTELYGPAVFGAMGKDEIAAMIARIKSDCDEYLKAIA